MPELGDLVVNGPNAWGWEPLIGALATRYRVQTGQVNLAVGASMANHLVCATLLRPGDHVVVESPGYEPLTALPEYLGARVGRFERSREDGYRVDPDRVEAALEGGTKLVIISDFHNPTGCPVGDEGLGALAPLADKHGFHVLVDEVYREFTYQSGERLAAHRSPRFISTCSLTKAYGLDGLRAGWILSDAPLAGQIRHLNDLFGIIMPHPSERLALRALGCLDRLRSDVDALLAVNRIRVEHLIAERGDLEWTMRSKYSSCQRS